MILELVLVAVGAPLVRDVLAGPLERWLWERQRLDDAVIAYDRWFAWYDDEPLVKLGTLAADRG